MMSDGEDNDWVAGLSGGQKTIDGTGAHSTRHVPIKILYSRRIIEGRKERVIWNIDVNVRNQSMKIAEDD